MSECLIVVTTERATATALARRFIDDTLAGSALIGTVQNPAQNQSAVESLAAIKAVLKRITDAAELARKPALEQQRSIIALEKELKAPLAAEAKRLEILTSEFAALELEKSRAAERARSNAISEMERERETKVEAAVAEAKTLDEAVNVRQAIREEYDLRAAAQFPVAPAPAVAKGQRVQEEWEIQVTSPLLLANHFPECVDIKPRMQAIKDKLNMGIELPGVSAKKVVRATTRATRERAALEVLP